MQEIWKPVPGYEGLYDVSNTGQVRALDRVVRSRWGTDKPIKGGLKAFAKNSQGYHSVHLYKVGKMGRAYVHRLVASVFLPNPQELPQVNHHDGDKSNNAVTNLEWCTGTSNCTHALRTNLYESAKGQQIASAKLTEAEVREVRELAARGEMHKDIASVFGIGRKAITKIVNHQRWRHVT